MKDQERKEIIYDYNCGMTITQLQKKYHHKFETIKEIIKNEPVHKKGRQEKRLDEIGKQQLRKLYCEEKRGQIYCAKQLNISQAVLKKELKELGIKIRTYAEAATVSNINRETYKDKDYFSIQSHNMAWLLGFIASDGTIRKDSNSIKIGLARKDREILEKIRTELKIEREVKDYTTTNGFDYSQLEWSCEQHKKDLSRYFIVPEKTFTLKPPYELAKTYWIDYIRGYFDGDGSVNLIQGKNLRWQVCSATPEILKFIVDFFFEEYHVQKVNLQKSNNLYYIQYSTNSTKLIYSFLYTPNSLFLKRKKEHFDNIVK